MVPSVAFQRTHANNDPSRFLKPWCQHQTPLRPHAGEIERPDVVELADQEAQEIDAQRNPPTRDARTPSAEKARPLARGPRHARVVEEGELGGYRTVLAPAAEERKCRRAQ